MKNVAYSLPRITPGYLPPAKVAISAPVTYNTAAYAAPLVAKFTSTPTTITSVGHGSVYDASYSNGAYYSAAPKVLAPAVATTYTPTAAPIACRFFIFEICIFLILTNKSHHSHSKCIFMKNHGIICSEIHFLLPILQNV